MFTCLCVRVRRRSVIPPKKKTVSWFSQKHFYFVIISGVRRLLRAIDAWIWPTPCQRRLWFAWWGEITDTKQQTVIRLEFVLGYSGIAEMIQQYFECWSVRANPSSRFHLLIKKNVFGKYSNRIDMLSWFSRQNLSITGDLIRWMYLW